VIAEVVDVEECLLKGCWSAKGSRGSARLSGSKDDVAVDAEESGSHCLSVCCVLTISMCFFFFLPFNFVVLILLFCKVYVLKRERKTNWWKGRSFLYCDLKLM